MIPQHFMRLEVFPLNTSGKIDRKALPDIDFQANREEYAPPTTTIEEELCRIWQELLGLEKIGIKDDFFRIGGDSILSIQLSSRLRNAGYYASVRDIFDRRTIESLARFIGERDKAGAIDAEQGRLKASLSCCPYSSGSLSGNSQSRTTGTSRSSYGCRSWI